ncbi:hypothetical protein F5877DRAFT_65673 [Lentinula edodes]|nr:hypothetical protein F5877DRAFT_65673 [Lentinula edodes]
MNIRTSGAEVVDCRSDGPNPKIELGEEDIVNGKGSISSIESLRALGVMNTGGDDFICNSKDAADSSSGVRTVWIVSILPVAAVLAMVAVALFVLVQTGPGEMTAAELGALVEIDKLEPGLPRIEKAGDAVEETAQGVDALDGPNSRIGTPPYETGAEAVNCVEEGGEGRYVASEGEDVLEWNRPRCCGTLKGESLGRGLGPARLGDELEAGATREVKESREEWIE